MSQLIYRAASVPDDRRDRSERVAEAVLVLLVGVVIGFFVYSMIDAWLL